MNSESNIQYYVQDDTLNPHIDNIISYKKFLESVLDEIKSNNYNKKMIKLLSCHIEKSLDKISNDITLFDYNEKEDENEDKTFTPSVKIVSVDSDTSDSDEESDATAYASDDNFENVSDNEDSKKKKLHFYKTKMELYSQGVSFVKPNTLHDMYNDEPEFLDEYSDYNSNGYSATTKDCLALQYPLSEACPKYTLDSKLDHVSGFNSKLDHVSGFNSKLDHVSGFNSKYSDYTPSQDIHSSSQTKSKSHGYFLRHESKDNLNKDSLDEKLDYYSSVYSSLTQQEQEQTKETLSPPTSTVNDSVKDINNETSNNKVEDQNQPPNLLKVNLKLKSKDKLANEFLNNNLELYNYHYLKSFNLDRINNYCNSVSLY
jgi:hypothetical protein